MTPPGAKPPTWKGDFAGVAVSAMGAVPTDEESTEISSVGPVRSKTTWWNVPVVGVAGGTKVPPFGAGRPQAQTVCAHPTNHPFSL